MVYITTKEKQAAHERTPRDVYFESLEEAYGSLPVPSDDYADIQHLIKEDFVSQGMTLDEANESAENEIERLQEATETIMEHYEKVAKLLGKTTKFA